MWVKVKAVTLPALNELDAGVAEGNAEGGGDGAADDDGFCGEGEEGRGDEGEKLQSRFAVVRVGHGSIVSGWRKNSTAG